MRIMSKDQQERLDKLAELAYGDFSLVQEALRNARPGETPTLDEVVEYILLHREEQKVAHG